MPPRKLTDKEQGELETRVKLFDQEFQELQKKYQLRIAAQYVFPGGLMITVPIQAFPIVAPAPATAAAPTPDTATKPD